jgi:hypothetical protein
MRLWRALDWLEPADGLVSSRAVVTTLDHQPMPSPTGCAVAMTKQGARIDEIPNQCCASVGVATIDCGPPRWARSGVVR